MLEVVPITLKEANAFVEQNHRHHGPTVGHKFSIGLSDGEKIVGVAIVGRPVARHLDDGWTLEVNRLCTDGTRNASICVSTLYSYITKGVFLSLTNADLPEKPIQHQQQPGHRQPHCHQPICVQPAVIK